VAPLLQEHATARDVYLPPGNWIDYQSGNSYSGGWQHLDAGKIPAVMLVREGTVIPQIKLAQSTMQLDWSHLELVGFVKGQGTIKGLVCLPADNQLHELTLTRQGKLFKVANDPLAGKVTWSVRSVGEH